ncbi:hypothetical protein H9Q72_013231 [Fusarium xylarioides]|uniref:Hydrophobin n=1 Tax=Fusarium xylarioides TaxID=221167 RepID=A0A9P7HKG6_9HYPO|nr:hypothetical protein H9Q72_013231 [Fusarium xylarioides]
MLKNLVVALAFATMASAAAPHRRDQYPDPNPTSIPGGCNPAHLGSCPDTTLASVPSSTGIPGGCNPAHPGSCPTPTAPVVVTAGAFRNTVNLVAAVGLVAAIL